MGDFFEFLYTALGLKGIYGNELANFLAGRATSLSPENQFVTIGFITIGIALAVVLIYYYVIGQWLCKPSWGSKITWLITLVINSLLAFLAGWQFTARDLDAGKMMVYNPETDMLVSLNIDGGNCLEFGLANAIVAAVLFFILTLCLKWWSRDFKHIPF